MTKKTFEIKDNLKANIVNQKENNTKIIYLVGSMSSNAVDDFFRLISEIDLKECNKIIFNLKELNYISADGLGAFLRIMKYVKNHNGEIILVSLQPQVAEVFNMLGFRNFLNIVNNMGVNKKAVVL